MRNKLLLLFLSLFFIIPIIHIQAQTCTNDSNCQSGQTCQSGQCQSGNSQSENTQSENDSVTLQNPLGSVDPAIIMGTVIEGILGLTGVLALVAFIAGGVIMMTSGGNAEKVKKGKDILVWAVIGLFIIFTSYSILKYVFDVLI